MRHAAAADLDAGLRDGVRGVCSAVASAEERVRTVEEHERVVRLVQHDALEVRVAHL